MLQNYFSYSSCCFLLLLYPPISQLFETAGCLNSQYHSEHFTVPRRSVIVVHNPPTGNTTHQWKDRFYSSFAAKIKVEASSEHSNTCFSKQCFVYCFLAKKLCITKTFDSVIYSILCYFLHFTLQYSPQHLFAILYFPLREKQI
jgi:hypothetical protein